MRKIPDNRLPRGTGNYSATKARALRNAYPFNLTQKEYAAIPVECYYRGSSAADGYSMYLDTIKPELGFTVGNAIWTCERHLGGKNINLVCANHKHLIDHGRMVKSKDMITNQI
jgi:hypothetical protein